MPFKVLWAELLAAAIIAITLYPLVIRPLLRFKAERKSPFTERLLRPPGESLRLRIEKLEEDMLGWVFAVVGVAFYLAISAQTVSSYLSAAVLLLPGVTALVFVARHLRRVIFERQDYYMGFLGERATAQYLTPLMSEGYEIYHDLPCSAASGAVFNLDHVIVGPNGLFVVETKARRKFVDVKPDEKAKVRYDAKTLEFPGGVSTKEPLDQIQANVRWLKKALEDRTGEPVEVRGVVSLPGWFVSDAVSQPTPAVKNPKQIPAWIEAQSPPKRAISPEQRKRIAAFLREKAEVEV